MSSEGTDTWVSGVESANLVKYTRTDMAYTQNLYNSYQVGAQKTSQYPIHPCGAAKQPSKGILLCVASFRQPLFMHCMHFVYIREHWGPGPGPKKYVCFGNNYNLKQSNSNKNECWSNTQQNTSWCTEPKKARVHERNQQKKIKKAKLWGQQIETQFRGNQSI